mgnify:CR=1 FL=1
MMLPILISLSLAPGSYFFCALAVVASTRRDGERRHGRNIPHANRHGILSLFPGLFCRESRKACAGWQAPAYSAR